MPRWEYCEIHLSDLPRKTKEIDLLNDASTNGWELGAHHCQQRRKPAMSVRRQMPMRQVTELSVGVLFRILRIFLGAAWKPQLISLSHGPPRSREFHNRMFGPRVKFRQDVNGIVCRARDLEKPIPASDPVTARYIRQYLELISGQANASVSHKVREFILELLPEGRCSIEHVAEHMGVDRRTIHRRLRHEGKTFTSIVESVRSEIVGRYLEDANRPLTLMEKKCSGSPS